MSYFDEHRFELGGRLYEYLGVRRFKSVASAGDYLNRFRRRHDPAFRNVRSYGDALDWEARTRLNEALHLLNFLFSVVMMSWLCYRGRYTWLPEIVVLTVLLNVYPILLQRYNRARIRRVRARRFRRVTASNSKQGGISGTSERRA
jgi:hypothetical protein